MTLFGVEHPDRLSGFRSASEAIYVRAVVQEPYSVSRTTLAGLIYRSWPNVPDLSSSELAMATWLPVPAPRPR
ncbi:hypothetical protein GCM10020358_67910 [Amorphoplanes nipponensis]|uniref:Uncharacterized protein n=1 Tax=Actinoplanes nipponensis TaxID=135950 RepID=A0A919JLX9_9ACTN|nr:hypothetical protein Ani05nite_51200 [Actinoplanes nipponensis]